MIDQQTIDKIHELLDANKVEFALHAEMDIMKQGYNWSKDFIKGCLRNGKMYSGKQLYPEDSKKQERYYCMHKQSIFSNLVLIAFLIKNNILIIHMQPLNKGSYEGRVFFGSTRLSP